jgi:hypothetical protein
MSGTCKLEKGKILCFEVEEGQYEFNFEDVLALKRGECRTHKDAILSVSEEREDEYLLEIDSTYKVTKYNLERLRKMPWMVVNL